MPRLILLVPYGAFRVLLWPIDRLSAWMDAHRALRRAYEATTSWDGLIGVRPVFSVAQSFRSTVGLSFFDERSLGRGTLLQGAFQADFKNAFLGALLLRPTPAHRPVEYWIDGGYAYRDDQIYTGVGFKTGKDFPITRYGIHQGVAMNHLTFRLARPLVLGLYGGVGVRRFFDGTQFGSDPPIALVYCPRLPGGRCASSDVSERFVPGWHAGSTFARAGLTLTYDTRDNLHRPSSGVVLHLRGDYSEGLAGDHARYFRLHGSAATAINLWRRSRVLVLRAQAEVVLPVGDTAVPFTELALLGGHDGVRGVRYGQYRDYSSLIVQAEYRWPIWMWLDAALFVDAGGIYGRYYRDFGLDPVVTAIGGALRMRTTRRFFMRLQAAYGFGEGWFVTFVGTADPL